jgi:surface antigen
MRTILILVSALLLAGCGKSTPIVMTTATGALLGGVVGASFGSGFLRVVTMAAGAGAGAYGGFRLGHLLYEEDVRAFDNTTERALRDAADGETLRWSNRRSGNFGTVTPVATYRDSYGRRCREYEVMVATREGAELGRGAACRTKAGGWKPTQPRG